MMNQTYLRVMNQTYLRVMNQTYQLELAKLLVTVKLVRSYCFTFTFRCDYRSLPQFFVFVFLVVVLLVIFTPSCFSYCHCSTSSISHTVVLSKCLHPTLQYPHKICEHAYQSFMVAYGTGKVRQLCSCNMLAGVVKVRLRYGRSTW